jgi:adenosylcobinamide-GDP ribazoletransferase
MAVLMALMPNARGAGLAQSVGRPVAATAALSIAVALACALAATGWVAIALALWLVPVVLWVGLVARARIGGQTGDILGAAQQLCEATILTVMAGTLSA